MTETPTPPRPRAARSTPTSRELEVVRLIAEGLSCREAAGRLSRSPRTIENHLRAVYQKWGVRNRVEFLRAAEERGLLSLDAGIPTTVPVRELERKAHALELIQHVNDRLAGHDRDSFFGALSLALADAFGTRWAGVSQIIGADTLERVALTADGRLAGFSRHPLGGSPCAEAITRGSFVVWDDLAAQFPDHPKVTHLGARSFAGVVLRDRAAGEVGVLHIFDDKPLDRRSLPLQVLKVLAPITTTELVLARALHQGCRALNPEAMAG